MAPMRAHWSLLSPRTPSWAQTPTRSFATEFRMHTTCGIARETFGPALGTRTRAVGRGATSLARTSLPLGRRGPRSSARRTPTAMVFRTATSLATRTAHGVSSRTRLWTHPRPFPNLTTIPPPLHPSTQPTLPSITIEPGQTPARSTGITHPGYATVKIGTGDLQADCANYTTNMDRYKALGLNISHVPLQYTPGIPVPAKLTTYMAWVFQMPVTEDMMAFKWVSLTKLNVRRRRRSSLTYS